jgi:hypothetical protein
LSQFVPKNPPKEGLNSAFKCAKKRLSKFWEVCMVVSSTCRKVNKNPVFSAKSNGLEPRLPVSLPKLQKAANFPIKLRNPYEAD